MKPDEIIRAWKDEEYRLNLSDAERDMLPENPAGAIELSDEDLGDVNGGTTTLPCIALGSAAISCYPACGSTVWKGTCAVVTIGCCPGDGGGTEFLLEG